MAKLRVHNLSMSLDGFVAGADQGVDNPLGVGGEQLHEWMFATRMWGRMVGTGEGSTGLDNEFAERGEENIGAHVMGRNMFGPIRGDWGDEQWRGWWGDDPPYHHDVSRASPGAGWAGPRPVSTATATATVITPPAATARCSAGRRRCRRIELLSCAPRHRRAHGPTPSRSPSATTLPVRRNCTGANTSFPSLTRHNPRIAEPSRRGGVRRTPPRRRLASVLRDDHSLR